MASIEPLHAWAHRTALRRFVRRIAAAMPVLAVCWASAAAATTYYVRSAGSDSNDGLTPATAFASVRPAARMLREPGDRLIVGPGTYREGNIAPFGNGTPAAPIVLFGDSSGKSTGDPPGPVTILPTNDPAATSGFYIRGRNDIVIEGFEVTGTKDAAIEVRHRRRTGAASTRIAIRNNTLRDSRMGIQIRTVGEIEVSGNHIVRAANGLLFDGMSSAQMQIRGNVLEDCFLGLVATNLLGAVIADNQVHSHARNLTLHATGQLTLSGNRLLGPTWGGFAYATDLTVTGNVVDAGILLHATGALDVSSNTIRQKLKIGGGPVHARLEQNTLDLAFIGSGGEFAINGNDGQTLAGKRLRTVVATGNHFSGPVILRADESAEVTENDAGALAVRSADVTVRRNAVNNQLRISADTATVMENGTGWLVLRVRSLPDPPLHRDTAFLIENNTVDGPLDSLEAMTMVLHGNTVAGPLRAIARRDIDIADNQTKGIACIAMDAGARVTVVENEARYSGGPGLAVVGAETANIVNNRVSDNAENGVAIRRSNQVEIIGNDVLSNVGGGMSVRVPLVGDCNEDVDVSVADILTMVGIALHRRPIHDCDAGDVDRDEKVSIGEMVLAVGAALETPVARPSTVAIRDNRVENNGRFGIDVFARASVLVSHNRVLRTAGIPLAVHGRGALGDALLNANVLGLGGAEGLLVEELGAVRIRNNVVFSNRDAGMLLRASPDAAAVNNLVYANGGPGIAVGVGDSRATTGTLVMNNTIFGNGNWGIVVGSGSVASTGTMIRNNILQQNIRGGITATSGALPGLTVEFNINTDGYDDKVSPAPTDLTVDPQFVGPAGIDGVLGNDKFDDDDFRVQPASAAIDAGSAPAVELGIRGSVVAGQPKDDGIVDLGYHYGADDQE